MCQFLVIQGKSESKLCYLRSKCVKMLVIKVKICQSLVIQGQDFGY